MKSTIKTRNGRAVVQPLTLSGEIQISITSWTGAMSAVTMTPDEIGALIFGLEQAAEAIEISRARTHHERQHDNAHC